MIEILLSTLIASSNLEKVNFYCSRVVGIPYASDSFTAEEWKKFVECRNSILKHK